MTNKYYVAYMFYSAVSFKQFKGGWFKNIEEFETPEDAEKFLEELKSSNDMEPLFDFVLQAYE